MGQLFAYTRLCCCCCCSLTLLDACLAYQQETQGLVSLLCHCFHSSSCACGWHQKISWEDGRGQLPIQTKRKRKKKKHIQKHCGGKYNKKKSAEGAPPGRCQHIASGTFIAQANCWTLFGVVWALPVEKQKEFHCKNDTKPNDLYRPPPGECQPLDSYKWVYSEALVQRKARKILIFSLKRNQKMFGSNGD